MLKEAMSTHGNQYARKAMKSEPNLSCTIEYLSRCSAEGLVLGQPGGGSKPFSQTGP